MSERAKPQKKKSLAKPAKSDRHVHFSAKLEVLPIPRTPAKKVFVPKKKDSAKAVAPPPPRRVRSVASQTTVLEAAPHYEARRMETLNVPSSKNGWILVAADELLRADFSAAGLLSSLTMVLPKQTPTPGPLAARAYQAAQMATNPTHTAIYCCASKSPFQLALGIRNCDNVICTMGLHFKNKSARELALFSALHDSLHACCWNAVAFIVSFLEEDAR